MVLFFICSHNRLPLQGCHCRVATKIIQQQKFHVVECTRVIMVTSSISHVAYAFTAYAIFFQLSSSDFVEFLCLNSSYACIPIFHAGGVDKVCKIIVCSSCVKYAALVSSMFAIGHTVQTPPFYVNAHVSRLERSGLS